MEIKTNRKWGFDLTSFGEGTEGANVFLKILAEMGISSNPIHDLENGAFIFANPYIMLVTGNNPITGLYGRGKGLNKELGYASYIGIEGDPETVDKLASLIRERAEHIKGECKHERQFI